MDTFFASPAQMRVYKDIKSGMAIRLQKLGSIRTDDAWNQFRSRYSYSMIAVCFRRIMHEMVVAGKADQVRNGLWFIHKNQYCYAKNKA